MSIELWLFIILAAVAIFSAALMLVSRNAVHSALFLVTNFLCVSFFYLMLNAPFLSMIQVTVYAGAIMVLFMFVIMLLGSQQLSEQGGRFSWVAPAAVALTTIFLIVAFLAVVQGNIGLLKPVQPDPQVRFIQAAAGVPDVDVYLTDQKMASSLNFRQATDFSAIRPGDYQVLVFPSCTEAGASKCADPIKSNAAPILAAPLKLTANTDTTLAISGTSDQLQLITIPTDLSTLNDDTTFRLTAINALPNSQPVTLFRRNPSVINPPDPKDTNAPKQLDPLARDLKYGDVGKTLTLSQGDYLLEWRQGDTLVDTVPVFASKGKTSELILLVPEFAPGQTTAHPAALRIDPVRTEETFGSPQQIGQSLLGTFVLPFELVSLLLLAAMVGAIIMTREEITKRVRQRVIVSPGARRINAAMVPANPRSAGTMDNLGVHEHAEEVVSGSIEETPRE